MQLKVLEERKRFNVVDCGRRWGKTILGIDVAIELALVGLPIGWFAPEYKLMAEAWRELLRALHPYITYKNVTERRIELVTGGVIEMWSLDSGDGGRSRKYARVIIDEAAMIPGLMNIWNDAIRPTLTDLKGDAWFFSTPKGRNDFWQLYQRGLDEYQEEWACWQMPTSANPFIDPDEIEAARRELPERSFAQEYMAEFLEDSAVFRGIREAATAKEQRYKDYNLNHHYVVGCDWAYSNDFSVFTVIDTTLKEQCYIDRSNKVDYMLQVQRLKELVNRFDVRVVMTENNSNRPLMEILRQEKIPIHEFHTGNESKQEIILSLMLAFERGELKILNDPILIGELQAFEAVPLSGGRTRYQAPPGLHDDCVMSLALAWEAAKNHQPVTIVNRHKQKYGQNLSHRGMRKPYANEIQYRSYRVQ